MLTQQIQHLDQYPFNKHSEDVVIHLLLLVKDIYTTLIVTTMSNGTNVNCLTLLYKIIEKVLCILFNKSIPVSTTLCTSLQLMRTNYHGTFNLIIYLFTIRAMLCRLVHRDYTLHKVYGELVERITYIINHYCKQKKEGQSIIDTSLNITNNNMLFNLLISDIPTYISTLLLKVGDVDPVLFNQRYNENLNRFFILDTSILEMIKSTITIEDSNVLYYLDYGLERGI